MKNQIANIKKNWKSESKKAAFVIVGFIGGQAIAKGLDWLAGKYPEYATAIKYGKPAVLAGGGWLLSSATTEQQMELKYLGYGLQTAGVYEGVKLVPIAKDFFSSSTTVSGLGSSYYMESEKPTIELGQFGINALPIKSIEMENAPEVKLDLPELGKEETDLEGTDDNNDIPNLGYDPERFEGVI